MTLTVWVSVAVVFILALILANTIKTMTNKKTVAVDLDGVLADYTDGWLGDDVIGLPIPGAKVALDELKRAGWTIIIYTSRPATATLKQWLEKHKIPYDAINFEPGDKEPWGKGVRKVRAHVYVDDRAVTFRGDWQKTLLDILDHRPWFYSCQDPKNEIQTPWLNVQVFNDAYFPGWMTNPLISYSNALASEVGEICGITKHWAGGGTNNKDVSWGDLKKELADLWIYLAVFVQALGITEREFYEVVKAKVLENTKRMDDNEKARDAGDVKPGPVERPQETWHITCVCGKVLDGQTLMDVFSHCMGCQDWIKMNYKHIQTFNLDQLGVKDTGAGWTCQKCGAYIPVCPDLDAEIINHIKNEHSQDDDGPDPDETGGLWHCDCGHTWGGDNPICPICHNTGTQDPDDAYENMADPWHCERCGSIWVGQSSKCPKCKGNGYKDDGPDGDDITDVNDNSDIQESIKRMNRDRGDE